MTDAGAGLAGRTLGDYALVRRVGSGGMGHVYLATQRGVNRAVALKVLRDHLASDPVARERFRAEAEAAARLAHPNIVQVYSAGEAEGFRFIALEFVDGRTLGDRLAADGPAPADEALVLLRQVAAALACAHAAGVVHRDIKPENVLLAPSGVVKVADFGLSRLSAEGEKPLDLTQTGMTLGTPLYMSPEQVQGKRVDPRSDLYSLGVTAYHLLSGAPPFAGANAFEVASRHVGAPVPDLRAARPGVPAPLAAAVARLMAKRPEDRYQSADELLADLDRVAAGRSLAAWAAPRPAGRRARRLLLAGALGMTGAALGWLLTPPRATPPTGGPLPPVEPPERFQTARERELRARLQDRATKPADHAALALDLAVLLFDAGHLAAADAAFAELEAEQRGGAKFPPQLAGKLGRAAVLARRGRVQESLAAFNSAFAARVGPVHRRRRRLRGARGRRARRCRGISRGGGHGAGQRRRSRRRGPCPRETGGQVFR